MGIPLNLTNQLLRVLGQQLAENNEQAATLCMFNELL